MLQLKTHKPPLAVTFIIDIVNYELGPYCQARGADVWIEDLDGDRVVLGFRCHPARRPEMRGWLEEAIARLVPGRPECVRVLDLTTFAGSRREG